MKERINFDAFVGAPGSQKRSTARVHGLNLASRGVPGVANRIVSSGDNADITIGVAFALLYRIVVRLHLWLFLLVGAVSLPWAC